MKSASGWLLTRICEEMHGQQNIKFSDTPRLCYRDQSLNVLHSNNLCLLRTLQHTKKEKLLTRHQIVIYIYIFPTQILLLIIQTRSRIKLMST
jgi:hypothetical protein